MPEQPSKPLLRVLKWEEFQHYHTGRGQPPWIKCYTNLLKKRAFMEMPAERQSLLFLIWLIASEKAGTITGTLEDLSFVVHRTVTVEDLLDLQAREFIELSTEATSAPEVVREDDHKAEVAPPMPSIKAKKLSPQAALMTPIDEAWRTYQPDPPTRQEYAVFGMWLRDKEHKGLGFTVAEIVESIHEIGPGGWLAKAGLPYLRRTIEGRKTRAAQPDTAAKILTLVRKAE